MAEVLELDLGSFTLGEMVDFEEHSDQPFADIFQAESAPTISGKSLASLVWVIKRKTDPDFTIAQAFAMKLDDFEIKRT